MSHTPDHCHQPGCWICSPSKHQELGQAAKKPIPELRFLGTTHRVSRHQLPKDALDEE